MSARKVFIITKNLYLELLKLLKESFINFFRSKLKIRSDTYRKSSIMKVKQFKLHLFTLLVIFLVLFHSPVFADDWRIVRSKNFKLIGNAGEKDIRQVAARLEQFREVFGSIFVNVKLNSPVPTNVIVFRSDDAFKPFKPKRADGKTDAMIGGYFLPGDEENYIAVPVGERPDLTYRVIFHEYVHFLLNASFGKSNIPPWFNEGVADYYSTFVVENDQDVKLGIFRQDYVDLLTHTKLQPLETIFSVSNEQLAQQGEHSRGLFYAESWCLIHYLMLNGQKQGLNKFLQAVINNTPPAQAFQEAFGINYPQMEKELVNYAAQNKFKFMNLHLKNKLAADDAMQAAPLADASADAYLGDLLYRLRRPEESASLLQKAVTLDDKESLAYTVLGMIKTRQENYRDAGGYLEKAVASDPQNSLALFYYAFNLSREYSGQAGFAKHYPPAVSEQIIAALKKSISLAPQFSKSYDLLAYMDIANNENLDEAMDSVMKTLSIQPGNVQFRLRLAQVYLRQGKIPEARVIAESLVQTTDVPAVKEGAQNLLLTIQRGREKSTQ